MAITEAELKNARVKNPILAELDALITEMKSTLMGMLAEGFIKGSAFGPTAENFVDTYTRYEEKLPKLLNQLDIELETEPPMHLAYDEAKGWKNVDPDQPAPGDKVQRVYRSGKAEEGTEYEYVGSFRNGHIVMADPGPKIHHDISCVRWFRRVKKVVTSAAPDKPTEKVTYQVLSSRELVDALVARDYEFDYSSSSWVTPSNGPDIRNSIFKYCGRVIEELTYATGRIPLIGEDWIQLEVDGSALPEWAFEKVTELVQEDNGCPM